MIRTHQKSILKVAFSLLMALSTLWVSAQNAPQNNITLPSKNLTRKSAIDEIQSQTAYKVVYSDNDFDTGATVNFGRTELALGSMLEKLIEGTSKSYSVDNNYILLYNNGKASEASRVAIVASRVVAGVVTDGNETPLKDVRVEVVDKDRWAMTDDNGRFSIAGVASGRQIVKLTTADGETVRYRQITVYAGNNTHVSLTISDDDLMSIEAESGEPARSTMRSNKYTAYYSQNTNDHVIRATNGEAKSEFTFIPVTDLQKNYMPKAAIKTNLLLLGTTTPNVVVELGLAKKWTVDLSVAYNPFRLQKGGINLFWFAQPELRYWLCQRFEKHFIGVHGIYGQFNIGQVDFLTKTFEEHRYKGWTAGAGVSYGYHIPMSKRWSWEFTVGVGYLYMKYDQFRCHECDEFVAKKERHYFGPTKAGVSLIFMIK